MALPSSKARFCAIACTALSPFGLAAQADQTSMVGSSFSPPHDSPPRDPRHLAGRSGSALGRPTTADSGDAQAHRAADQATSTAAALKLASSPARSTASAGLGSTFSARDRCTAFVLETVDPVHRSEAPCSMSPDGGMQRSLLVGGCRQIQAEVSVMASSSFSSRSEARPGNCHGPFCMKWSANGELSELDLLDVIQRLAVFDPNLSVMSSCSLQEEHN